MLRNQRFRKAPPPPPLATVRVAWRVQIGAFAGFCWPNGQQNRIQRRQKRWWWWWVGGGVCVCGGGEGGGVIEGLLFPAAGLRRRLLSHARAAKYISTLHFPHKGFTPA